MQVIGSVAFQAGGGGMGTILFMVLMFALLFFLIILPQQRRQKKWQAMLAELKTGDKVTTTGGVRGTIVALRDDAIHLRVPPDNIRIEVARGAIQAVNREEVAKVE